MSKQTRAPISIHSIDEPPAALPREGVRTDPQPPPESGKPQEKQTWRKAETRKNRRGVAFYLPPTAFRQLRRLMADTDRTIQDLMVEATDDLFAKYSLARLARVEEKEGEAA
jgi:hypothetical protein